MSCSYVKHLFLLICHFSRYVYAMVLSVWVYALCLSLPPILFNWGTYGFEAGNISCSVSWQLHDPETHNDTYIGFLFIFGFFVPVFVIFGCYYSIIKTLRNIRRRLGEFLLYFLFFFFNSKYAYTENLFNYFLITVLVLQVRTIKGKRKSQRWCQ